MTIQLYHADCLDVLAGLADSSIDVIVTDPPYNAINRDSGGLRSFDKGVADSSVIDIDVLAREFYRIARGSIYVWCSDEQYTDWTMAFKGLSLTTRICAWSKTNPSPMNGQRLWLSALELCVFARKPNAPFYRHCASPLWQGPSERVKDFTTPKPVWLMTELITASCPPNGIVLDPFMGSGTTGVSCVQTDRSFIGIEKYAKHFAIAEKRIAEAQPPLFVE